MGCKWRLVEGKGRQKRKTCFDISPFPPYFSSFSSKKPLQLSIVTDNPFPDSLTLKQIRQRRLKDEQEQFSVEHYIGGFLFSSHLIYLFYSLIPFPSLQQILLNLNLVIINTWIRSSPFGRENNKRERKSNSHNQNHNKNNKRNHNNNKGLFLFLSVNTKRRKQGGKKDC